MTAYKRREWRVGTTVAPTTVELERRPSIAAKQVGGPFVAGGVHETASTAARRSRRLRRPRPAASCGMAGGQAVATSTSKTVLPSLLIRERERERGGGGQLVMTNERSIHPWNSNYNSVFTNQTAEEKTGKTIDKR